MQFCMKLNRQVTFSRILILHLQTIAFSSDPPLMSPEPRIFSICKIQKCSEPKHVHQ
jgi:hypothetical protein